MTVTLELPPQGHARGMSLDALLRDVLVARQSLPGAAEMTAEQWVDEFTAWIHSPSGDDLPLLSGEAIGREFIYSERGL